MNSFYAWCCQGRVLLKVRSKYLCLVMYFLKSVGCRWNYFVEGNLDLNIAHFRLKAVFCFGRISFRAQLVSFFAIMATAHLHAY